MLSEVLRFLKEEVNNHLRMTGGCRPTDPEQETVVFPSTDNVDTPDLKAEHVTPLVENLEEDHTVRAADPNRRVMPDGTTQQVKPPIILNVYVLFVARFKEYETCMHLLSRIIAFFQSHRVFDHDSAPALDGAVEKLGLELVTLSFLEQNNLWGVLRAAYQPCLLYRLRMVAFLDQDGIAAPRIVETITTSVPAGVGRGAT